MARKKTVEEVVGHATEVPRDGWGRPLIIPPDGGKPVAYQRCTTFIKALEDTYGLEQWAKRMVAVGLARRPDLVLRAGSTADKKILDGVCEAAMEAAGSSSKATIGTALHELTERADRGEHLVPDDYGAYGSDLFAYAVATGHLVKRDIEVFVVHDGLKVGGTFDRIVLVDDAAYVADLKTGSIEYDTAKIAMQLAVYANSQRYDPATGARSPLEVDTERGIIIHLPAGTGTCSLHWVDLELGLDGVNLAAQVRVWRKLKMKLVAF